jgi:alkylhydroperoxidase family enzyme
VDINTASGEAAGIPEEKFAHLADYAGHQAFTPRERLALAYADAMTITGQDSSDEMFAALRREFSEDEIIELTAHVAFENFRSRFNHALRIEAQGFCRLPRT